MYGLMFQEYETPDLNLTDWPNFINTKYMQFNSKSAEVLKSS